MSFINKIEQIKEELELDTVLKLGNTKYYLKSRQGRYDVRTSKGLQWSSADYKKAVNYFIKLVQDGMIEAKKNIMKVMQEYNAELDECNNKLAELHSKIKRG